MEAEGEGSETAAIGGCATCSADKSACEECAPSWGLASDGTCVKVGTAGVNVMPPFHCSCMQCTAWLCLPVSLLLIVSPALVSPAVRPAWSLGRLLHQVQR